MYRYEYRVLKKYLLVGIFLFINQLSRASHIFGGDFNMNATNIRGYYLFNLNIYADSTTLRTGNNDASVRVYIFRSSDNVRMQSFILPQISIKPIIYENKTCAGQQELSTLIINYSAEIYLDPTRYTHKQGYYIVWERCCRTAGTDNIINNGKNVGMVFMLEFPAIMPDNKYLKNSSPVFNPPNGDYICLNRKFTMNMAATDADGDELRYSLVTPLQGYTDENNPVGSGQPYTAYPNITWASGFNLDNTIPGKPSLKIDNRTGTISVIATKLGLYVFSIMVEEYRNKERIGAVRRDFQLKVVDCSGAPPPTPIVFASSNKTIPATTVEICTNEKIDLTFQSTNKVNYQWKKNGLNMANETTNTLNIKEIGDYQVVASYASKCALDTVSQVVKITKGKSPDGVLLPKDSIGICNNQSAILTATNANSFNYRWYKDDTVLPNETRNTLTTNKVGVYMVEIKSNTFRCATYDTVVVTQLVNPPKPLIKSDKNWLCKNDSIKILLDTQYDFVVEWSQNGKVIPTKNQKYIYVLQDGNYKASVLKNGCKTNSDSINIQRVKDDTVVFDSIAPICYNDTLLLALKATPPNGKFVGKSVEKDKVNIKTLGVGEHTITYEATINGCTVIKSQILKVKDIPHITLPSYIVQPINSKVEINATADNPTAYEYNWLPPIDLSDIYVLNPTASLKQSTTYTLLATNTEGCITQKSTRIVVVNLLYPADAFTPNGDNLNDTWLIGNIENFPNAEVFIYNRWGELIYYDKDGYRKSWDGTYQGKNVEAGNYTYMIVPHAELNSIATIRGSLLVIY